MAEPTCIHAVPQAADQLHGICIFCYRDRLGAARAENAALRERVRVLEWVRIVAENLDPADGSEDLSEALAAAKPAAQEGEESADG